MNAQPKIMMVRVTFTSQPNSPMDGMALMEVNLNVPAKKMSPAEQISESTE